jgi:hypothetical protein
MIFWRLDWILIQNSNLNRVLNWRLPHVAILFEGTASGGSVFWAVGLKEDWTHQINWYPFIKWCVLIHAMKIWRSRANRGGGCSPARVPARNPGEGALEVDDGELPMVSRGNGVDDSMQRGERDPMVTTAASIVSRGRSRGRVELGDGAGVLRALVISSFHCKTWWEKASERAPEREEKVGRGMERRDDPQV